MRQKKEKNNKMKMICNKKLLLNIDSIIDFFIDFK